MKNIIYKNTRLENITEFRDLANLYLQKTFPLNRSILNSGVKETLEILQEAVDFDIIKIDTGYKCYDWEVPQQWEVTDAYIEVDGKKILDFKHNNLHVLNYSAPIDAVISFDELKDHLHHIENLPDAIPYKTSYYKREWGFCLTYNQFKDLDKTASYHVKIDSGFSDGNIYIAEKVLPGESKDEILISGYTCHPSMANDSLSGVIMWMMLLKALSKEKLKYTYRFVLLPETIGAIAYLHNKEKEIKANVKRGFVLTTCGGPGEFGYKSSFLGTDIIDFSVKDSLKELKDNFIEYPFDVHGSDERQYSSPHFRIPCVTVSKDKYYEYREYHTSLDNLDFVKPEYLVETFEVYLNAIQNLELYDLRFRSLNPACEPFFSKRNLYSSYGITINNTAKYTSRIRDSIYTTSENVAITGAEIDTILWFLFWADGENTLGDIAKRSGKHISELYQIAIKLLALELVEIQ